MNKWFAVAPALVFFLLLGTPIVFAGLFGGDDVYIIRKTGGDSNIQFSCAVGQAVKDYNSRSGLYSCISVGSGGGNINGSGGVGQLTYFTDTNIITGIPNSSVSGNALTLAGIGVFQLASLSGVAPKIVSGNLAEEIGLESSSDELIAVKTVEAVKCIGLF